MADRYWVAAAGGDWTTTANWSTTSGGAGGASVPTSADNVFFNLNRTGTITSAGVTGVTPCRDFTVSNGTYTFNFLTGSSIVQINGSLDITATSGSWTGTSTVIFTTGSSTLRAPYSINTGGVQFNASLTLLSNMTFTGSGLTSTLSSSVTLNGFNLSVPTYIVSGATSRTIAFGDNFIYLTSTTAAATVLSISSATAITYTGNGGFSTAMTTTRSISVVLTAARQAIAGARPNLFITSGASTPTFTDGSFFGKLDFTGSTCTPAVSASTLGIGVDTLTLATGGTYTSLIPIFTATQTWTPQFSKQLAGMGVSGLSGSVTLTMGGTQSFPTTAQFRHNSGTFDLGGLDFTIGTFVSTNTETRSIAFGSNDIILANTTAGATNLDMADATGFTYTGTGGFKAAASLTRVFAFGSTGGSATIAPNLTFTGSGTSIQTISTGSWFKTLDFGTTAFALPTTALNLNSVVLSSGGTYTGLTPTMRGTGTITSNGKTIAALTINHTGTTTFDGPVAYALATAITTLTSGTLALNGNDLTTGTFVSTVSNTRSIAFGSNYIILATTTAAATNLSMATATGFTYTGTGGFKAAANITRTFTFGTSGGTASNAPNFSLTDSGTSVQTFTTGGVFNNLNFGTTAFTIGTTTLNIYGTLTLSSGGTFTALTVTGGGTSSLFGNSKSIAALTINGTSTTITNAITVVGTTTLTTGVFDLNGINFSTGTFSSTGSGVRSVIFGTSSITLTTTTAAQTNVSMATATNFTASASGAGGFYAAMSVTRTFNVGSAVAPTVAPSLYLTSGSAVPTFGSDSYFDTLSFGTCSFTVAAIAVLCKSFIASSSTVNNTALTLTMNGTGTFSPRSASTLLALTINNSGGTTTLGSNTTPGNVTATTTTFTGSGTFDLNGFSFTSGTTNKNGVTLTNSVIGTAVNFTTTGVFTLNTALGLTLPITADTTFVAGTSFVQTLGDVTINSTQTFGATCTYTLTAGALTLNSGSSLTLGTFSSNNSNVRSINVGTGYIYLTTSTAGTVLSMNNCINLTYTGTGGFSTSMTVARTFVCNIGFDVIPSLAPNLFITGGSSAATIQASSCFNSVVISGGTFALTPSASSAVLYCRSFSSIATISFANNIELNMAESGGTVSVLNTSTTTGVGLGFLNIEHDYGSPGVTSLASDCYVCKTTATLTDSSLVFTQGGLDLNGFNIYAITVTSVTASTRSINYGNNFIYIINGGGVDIDDPRTFTHTGAGGFSVDLTGQTSNTGFNMGTASINATAANQCPNVFITGVYGTGGFSFDGEFYTVDLGTNAYTLSDSFGCVNFTASPNGTYTGTALTSIFESGTFDFKGKTFTTLDITVPEGQTTTFASSVTVSSSSGFDHVSGNIDLNGNTLNVGNYISSGTGARQILGTGTINCSVAWTTTSGSLFSGSGSYTINMTRVSTAKTFTGDGGSYGTLVQAGTGVLSIVGNNTFTDIQATTIPSTIRFTAGSTQTLSNFTLSGTAGNLVTINSLTSGTQFNLSKSSGTVTVDYLSITDSNVTGGAYWGTTTSTFVSNNTGWNVVPSVAINGQFFTFF
jgi:hypothetical protein